MKELASLLIGIYTIIKNNYTLLKAFRAELVSSLEL